MKVGEIHTHVFMSDDAQQYFNAWSDVFGADNTKKLLSTVLGMLTGHGEKL